MLTHVRTNTDCADCVYAWSDWDVEDCSKGSRYRSQIIVQDGYNGGVECTLYPNFESETEGELLN